MNVRTWTFEPLPDLPEIDLVVVDVFMAEHLAPVADQVISIWNTDPPGTMTPWVRPGWLQAHPHAAVFEFDDVTRDHDGYTAPREHEVAQILALAPGLKGRVLIHCAAGISRSSAAAYVLLGALLGPGQEGKALQILRQIRERTEARGWRDEIGFSPNLRLVELADRRLGRKGDLFETLRDVRL